MVEVEKEEETGIVLGVDFGTTNLCYSVWNNREKTFDIVLNEQCEKVTPACINFGMEATIIGKAARDDILTPADFCVNIIKRFIGKTLSDQLLHKDNNYIPYQIQQEKDTESLQVGINDKGYSFEQIALMFFNNIIKNVEETVQEKVKGLVFSVPDSFGITQRQAIKRAAKLTNVENVRMITDTIATALYYDHINKLGADENILICDFGGGSLDISIINIKNHVCKVISSSGDSHLGGEDLDIALYDYCIAQFEENGGGDISNIPNAKKLLKSQCEKAKTTLSTKKQAKINIDKLDIVSNLSMQFTRELFEDICSNHFNQIIKHLTIALRESKLQKEQLNHILVLGGSSQIPKVQEIIKKFFENSKVLSFMDNNESICFGATIYAEKLRKTELFKHRKIYEIVPSSLGIRIEGDLMSVLIPRGTRIPVKALQNYITTQDQQNRIRFEVYEGERKFIKDNKLIAKLLLNGIPKMQRGKVKVDVVFSIDEDGLLTITVTEITTQISNSLTTNENGNISSDEIQKSLKEAEESIEKDSKEVDRIKAKLKLSDSINEVMHSNTGNDEMKKTADGYQTWLKRSPYATKHDYEAKQNDLLNTFQKTLQTTESNLHCEQNKKALNDTSQRSKKDKDEGKK